MAYFDYMSKMKQEKPTVCKCKLCGKKPSEIQEYKTLAEAEGYSSPEDAVRGEEGTYNPRTGLFYCTTCYIKAGCPSGMA